MAMDPVTLKVAAGQTDSHTQNKISASAPVDRKRPTSRVPKTQTLLVPAHNSSVSLICGVLFVAIRGTMFLGR